MSTSTHTLDIVALGTRIHHLQLLRAGIAAAIVLWAFTAEPVAGYAPPVAPVLGYAVATILAEVFWRGSRRRGLAVFNLMLLIDGLVLAWASTATGGVSSPLFHLTVAHVGAVALLASYRTGTKIALWHSLLLLVAQYAKIGGLLPGQAESLPQLAAVLAALWGIALATAIFSAVNERELRRQRYDLEALSRLADDLERVPHDVDVADRLLTHLAATFGFQRGVILSLDDQGARPLSRHGDDDMTPTSRPVVSPLVESVSAGRRSMLVGRLDPDEEFDLLRLLPGAANLLLTPLRVDGQVVGVVVLEHTRPRLAWRTLTMIERFCGHAALALGSARLLAQLHTMASTDGLTGLANRREFDTRLRRELSRGTRSGAPTSLAIIDIDHFKPLNDTHGHQAGDDVLREVARLLRQSCRDFDLVARYGGEEFAVVLPQTDAQAGWQIAERIRRTIDGGPTPLPITVSIGVATTSGGRPATPEDLIGHADAAMYEAKTSGRNQVRLARQERGEHLRPVTSGAA